MSLHLLQPLLTLLIRLARQAAGEPTQSTKVSNFAATAEADAISELSSVDPLAINDTDDFGYCGFEIYRDAT